MKKYLLTDGSTTTKIELYVVDLLKLYLTAYEKDFPGCPNVGFNFIISNIREDELAAEVRERVSDLIEKIEDSLPSGNSITVDEITIIDSTSANVVITVNDTTTEEIKIELE